jgi:hypothetical protein
MDPLPPDIILTAIVISFAVGALMLTICYRVYRDHGTDNPQELPVDDDFTQAGKLQSVPAAAYPSDGSGQLNSALHLQVTGEGRSADRPVPQREGERR